MWLDTETPGTRLQPAMAPALGSVSPWLIFAIVWRRKYSIGFVGVILSALAVFGAMRMSPSFVATTSVLMQERSPSALDIPTTSGLIAIDSLAVRTQTDIMRSTGIAHDLVEEMHLADMPEFNPPPGLLERLRRFAGLAPPPAPPSAAAREEAATQKLLSMMTIVNDGRSYVIAINVKVTAPSPALAQHAAALSADIANGLAASYIRFSRKVKADNIRRSKSLFDERIEDLQAKMRASQQAVQTYRAEKGLVEDRAVSGEGRAVSIASQQMAQLNSELVTATNDRVQKEASLTQISQARGSQDIGQLRAIPEIVGSPLIQRLREEQVDLMSKVASLAANHRAEWPELVALRSSLKDVSGEIDTEIAKIVASLRNGAASARAREATLTAQLGRLQGQVAGQGELEIKLHELQNAADTDQMIYSTFLRRSEESANAIGMQEPDALVLSAASVPLSPAPPSAKQIGVLGVLGSFSIAVLIALLRERMSAGFRIPEQLEANLGVITLGLIPKVRNLRKAARFNDPNEPFAEAILSVRTMLRLERQHSPQVVMVTSALPREGKTVLSASLARHAALSGQRVLIIDCDLRRPAVSRAFHDAQPRDCEEISGVSGWQGVRLFTDSASPLHVCQLRAGGRRPPDLLASPQMRALIAYTRLHYDFIVLDTPPALVVTDALMLSTQVDATLFVVQWAKTPQKLVDRAVATLRASGAKIAGAVITQVNIADLSASDGAHGYVYTKYPTYLLAPGSR